VTFMSTKWPICAHFEDQKTADRRFPFFVLSSLLDSQTFQGTLTTKTHREMKKGLRKAQSAKFGENVALWNRLFSVCQGGVTMIHSKTY